MNESPGSEPRLYFYHIPKTAGTTALDYVHTIFGAENVNDWGIWDDLIVQPPDESQWWRAHWGHYLGMLDAFADITTLKMTLLRDPLDRTVSHYLHVQRDPEHPVYSLVSGQSLLQFVTDERTNWMVTDYQAVYLYKQDLDVRSLYRGHQRPPTPGIFQQELESLPLPGLTEASLFATCERRLKAFFRVDTAERCDEAMHELARTVGRTVPPSFARQMERPRTQELPTLDDATVRAITRATRVDRALYDMVREGPIRNGEWPGGPFA